MQLTRSLRSLALVSLLFVPIPALAQTALATATRTTTVPMSQGATSSGASGIGIGVKFGPLFSSIKTADADFGNRTGFIGGLFIGGNRGGVVGVGVDILYARKGADNQTLDYINVPIYARINVGSQSRSRASMYGIVGLDLNFLLKAKFSLTDTDNRDDFSAADYGLALGLGAEITRFVIEGRYTKGLGNIVKAAGVADAKSQSFAVMFGVRLN